MSSITKSKHIKDADIITVKNAHNDSDTTARIIVQNNIGYIPAVSVIIPVYNSEKYLRECLDSVINQTLKNIEIICIDDGSTDGSMDILCEYARKDNRITILSQSNLHAGVARNAGLAVARGKYVHFLDSDDWLELDSYQKMVELFSDADVDFIKFKSSSFDNKKHQVVQSYFTNIAGVKSDKFDSVLTLKDNLVDLLHVSDAPWSGIYKTDFVRKNNILFDALLCANDTTFYYRCLTSMSKMYLSSQRFVYYRINNSSSLIGIRAYNFDCQITQYYNIMTVVKEFPENIKNAVHLHLVHALLWRADGYLKNPLLEDVYKAKILDDLSVFFKDIDVDKLTAEDNLLYHSIFCDVPFVSVIVPVYNSEHWLTACLDSLSNQTLRNIEIICVNDGSTDGSLEILNKYAASDGRFVVINNEKNSGSPGVVKNIGMSHARGIYIGIVDSDDYVDANYFDVLYNNAIKNNADISMTCSVMNTYTDCPSVKSEMVQPGVYSDIKSRTPLIKRYGSNCTKIYRRQFLIDNNITCCTVRNIAEDNLFTSTAMCMANRVAVVDNTTYYYCHHENSVTSHHRTEHDFYITEVYKQIDEYIREHCIESERCNECLNAVNARKIQDFQWFLNDVNPMYSIPFKRLIQSEFPDIYYDVLGREHELIVSLTSYPARIDTINQVVESLLNQKRTADRIILWLAPEQFPNREKDLPQQLLDLTKYGLTIDWYHDIRSYKKLNPTLKKYPDAIIVTADDDAIYGPTWLEKLVNSYIKYPHDIHAHRVTKFFHTVYGFDIVSGGTCYNEGSSCLNKLVGLGGVLYPPHCLHPDVLDEDLIKKLAPTNDDQWYWFMGILNGYNVRVVDGAEIDVQYVPGTQDCGLCTINDSGPRLFWHDFKNLISYYPQVYKKLLLESTKHKGKKLMEMPYKHELEKWWYGLTGKRLNLRNPKTFNEKIQWLKLYDSTPIKTRLADKYLVRDWVAETIGEQYLIPLLGVYDRFEDIDFAKLPNRFVIKCNHGSGYNIIVTDKSKLDLTDVKSKLDKWMSENFAFKFGVELHYRDIPRKIIIEEFLDEIANNLYDYRFFCCNGRVEQIWLDVGSGTPEHKRKIYDKNWQELMFTVKWPRLETDVQKPDNLKEMIELSEKMSKDFALVRVDFYNVNGRIYFGEMTFTSMSGTGVFSSKREDLKLASKIKLPKRAYNIDTGEYFMPPYSSLFKTYILFPYYWFALRRLRKSVQRTLPV